ncbi:response regulator transcription factor [Algihabitans sp.]|uniref:response regulator transcription factor n=1 Tax=Algihabitans sp. TaxID=2821514 RepID=UPI003BA9D7B8
MKSQRILIIEDDEFTRRLLAAFLEKSGFLITEGGDGRDLHARTRETSFDLIVLDLNLPDEDGLVLTRQLRARSRVPILMLTSRDDEANRLVGFELGADDYVTKPCNPNELLARVRAILNRASSSDAETSSEPIALRDYALDLERHCLTDAQGEEVQLTAGEFHLLSALAMAKGRVLSRAQLIDAVGGPEDALTERSVDVLISRLRRKVEANPQEPDLIITVPRYGYRLALS